VSAAHNPEASLPDQSLIEASTADLLVIRNAQQRTPREQRQHRRPWQGICSSNRPLWRGNA